MEEGEGRDQKSMAESFKNLKIWQKAVDLVEIVYRITSKFPREELFGLTSQLRRAVTSVSSNIAEGSSRVSKRDFTRFVDISIGSLHEIENLLEISRRLRYISSAQFKSLEGEIAQLGLQLGGFRKYLQK